MRRPLLGKINPYTKNKFMLYIDRIFCSQMDTLGKNSGCEKEQQNNMYFIIIAFIIPWLIVLLHLHPKDKKLIPLIGPFGVVVSFLTNELGLYFGFWEVYPFPDSKTIATLPFNLGLFPILGCYMIFFIKKRMTHPYFVVFLATLFTTILEFIFVLMG
ncbi:hypothetical protein [Domibacillus aminovorans]|uniref:hypothetical protein n=1 Tax=Domibacillus aminovorans TaxID=29332 RepID=UPI001FCFFABC|nr:hypothetical protein [Domibacillus aminovorans]